jgi:hypothetical protein
MREFEGHDNRDNAEREDEEYREDDKSDHLRELQKLIVFKTYSFVDVSFVSVIESSQLNWEPN